MLDVHGYFHVLGSDCLLDQASEDHGARLDSDVLHELQHFHRFVHLAVLSLEFDQDGESHVGRLDLGGLHFLE